ncbi:MAG: putative unusual protein kinase regulating ubiquinone biosynthesis (AarF/ABC1/UbiB family) [Alteromonadaceae bacterium]|jgi:predicted unusual protein kinase regulating ubiquinone biosynthesis (AarF/ABC1/UbiB family)
MKTVNEVPTSKLKRSAIAGLAVTKLGLKHVSYKARNALNKKTNTEISQQRHEEQMGELIFSLLSQLRGTAIKISQQLSMETQILPKTVRDKLQLACHKVPPINRALVRKQLVQELGDIPSTLFKAFDSKAFSAASIGQVHKAVSHKGQTLAVKVQYPGIGATIENDLDMVKKLLWLLIKTHKNMPKKHVLEQVMNEVTSRLHEEVDYVNEANNLRWFKNTQTLEGIVIPYVVDDLSATRVLTMEMLSGQHIDEWLSTMPTQASRNDLGQKLFDFFWYCVLDLKKINADPHPGNFIVLANDKLGVIDFGCVRDLSQAFTNGIAKAIPIMVDVYIHKINFEQLFNSYKQLKFIEDNVSLDLFTIELIPDLQNYGAWFAQAYVKNTFDFKNKTPCPGRPENTNGSALRLLNGMYSEQLCFDRAHLGLMNLLSQIGADISTDYLRFHENN